MKNKITPFLWFDGKAELDGQEFIALNGGPHFTFTPAISLFVNCETQEEVDELWEKLSEGGAKSQCGLAHGQVRPRSTSVA